MAEMFEVTSMAAPEVFTYSWRIEDLAAILTTHDTVETLHLTVPGTAEKVFRLRCNLLGRPSSVTVGGVEGNKAAGYLLLRLQVVSNENNLKLKGSVTVTADGHTETGWIGKLMGKEFVLVYSTGCTENSLNFVNNDQTKKETRKEALTVTDFVVAATPGSSLDIQVELTFPGKVINSAGFNIADINEKSVGEELGGLLEDPVFSDFTLECCGVKFPCHKAILAARSKVFNKMFAANMKETKTEMAKMTMKVETLKAMLEFIYSGEVSGDINNAELLEVADMYELPGLVAICFNSFKTMVSIEDVTDVLIISDRHGLADFKKLAMEKVVEHRERFMKDDKFHEKMTPCPKLLLELLQQ